MLSSIEQLLNTVQIWLVVEPVDMRLGIDGLSARIQVSQNRSACDGKAYIFTNKRRNRLKMILWDGNGVWLAQRRLHKGSFTWPQDNRSFFTLEDQEWLWLIAGVDWQRCLAKPDSNWRV